MNKGLDKTLVPLNLVMKMSSILREYLTVENERGVTVHKGGLIRTFMHKVPDADIEREVKVVLYPYDKSKGVYIVLSIDEQPNEGEELCDNCNEIKPEDDFSTDDRITSGGHENICNDCVNDGYGQ